MSIVNFPGRAYKKSVLPAIDRVMAKRNPKIILGSKDISAVPLNQVISVSDNWQLDSVSFKFSGATARDFGFSFIHGRNVLTNYNNYLWFHVVGTLPQKIVLSENFYTGTQLAAELQTQLNANAAYVAAGITFVVTYANLTGLFVITPSSSTIKYLQENDAAMLSNYDSIGGHLFGLTTNSTSFGLNVTTDTPVPGLDDDLGIIWNTASTALSYYHDTFHILSVDQALCLKTGVAPITVDWTAVYEEII